MTVNAHERHMCDAIAQAAGIGTPADNVQVDSRRPSWSARSATLARWPSSATT
jgi:hypothetical protein